MILHLVVLKKYVCCSAEPPTLTSPYSFGEFPYVSSFQLEKRFPQQMCLQELSKGKVFIIRRTKIGKLGRFFLACIQEGNSENCSEKIFSP